MSVSMLIYVMVHLSILPHVIIQGSLLVTQHDEIILINKQKYTISELT